MKNFFDGVPEEVLLNLFSFFSEQQRRTVAKVNHRFNALARDKTFYSDNFISICNKIETSANYKPLITNQELYDLVVDANGNAKHSPRKTALAIQPFFCGPNLGKTYILKLAIKAPIDGSDDLAVWHIDDSTIVSINSNGEVNFHKKENIERSIFNAPLTHLNLDEFLNMECLHPKARNLKRSFPD